MRKFSGFTLVELMITVVIIGILATIAVPLYMRSVERSQCAQAIQVLKTMRNAALSFYNENETFAGMSEPNLEDQVGANFYSDGSNPNWSYAITAATATQLTLTATRLSGPWSSNPTITLSDDIAGGVNCAWGGTYPRNNPGNF